MSFLTDEHKAAHLQMARNWIEKKEADPEFPNSIVTIDESWVRNPESVIECFW